MKKLPIWWPDNPYPKSVFTATQEDYEAAMPDDVKRTSISGFICREMFNAVSQTILRRLESQIEAMEEYMDPEDIKRIKESLLE